VDEELISASDCHPLASASPTATEITVRRDTVLAGADASFC